MKVVRVGNGRETETPQNWAEGEAMLTSALGAYYDDRGKNLARLSIAARVAFGLFGARFMAPDPTTALLYVLQELCRRKGAGLDEPGGRAKRMKARERAD
jgi:hypothetical protein